MDNLRIDGFGLLSLRDEPVSGTACAQESKTPELDFQASSPLLSRMPSFFAFTSFASFAPFAVKILWAT